VSCRTLSNTQYRVMPSRTYRLFHPIRLSVALILSKGEVETCQQRMLAVEYRASSNCFDHQQYLHHLGADETYLRIPIAPGDSISAKGMSKG
jgi:hypothetical protein